MDEQRQIREEREKRWRAWMIAGQSGDAAAYEKLLFDVELQDEFFSLQNLKRR